MTGTGQCNDNLTAIYHSTLAFENELFQNVCQYQSICQRRKIIIIGYSTVFCKIRDFICTSLRSTEIVSDER